MIETTTTLTCFFSQLFGHVILWPVGLPWFREKHPCHTGVSKNRCFPPNHPFVHRVFHDFHHPFWGVNTTPIFGSTPTRWMCKSSRARTNSHAMPSLWTIGFWYGTWRYGTLAVNNGGNMKKSEKSHPYLLMYRRIKCWKRIYFGYLHVSYCVCGQSKNCREMYEWLSTVGRNPIGTTQMFL